MTTEYEPVQRGSLPSRPGAAPLAPSTPAAGAKMSVTPASSTIPHAAPQHQPAKSTSSSATPQPAPPPVPAPQTAPELPAISAPSTAPPLRLSPDPASLAVPLSVIGGDAANDETGGANAIAATTTAGTSIYDVDPTTFAQKPWRKAGADLSDWFNFGFDEETWNRYTDIKRGRTEMRERFGREVSMDWAPFALLCAPC